MSAPELTFDLGPVRCPVDGCWAAFGIPDQYTTARENALAAHLMSDEHRQNATSFTIAAPAQPEQPLHQRLAEAVRSAPTGRFNAATIADAVLAAVQPDLDARYAEIQQLRAQLAEVRSLHTFAKHMSIDICDECSIKRRTGPRPDDWERMAVVPWPCPTTLATTPRPTT